MRRIDKFGQFLDATGPEHGHVAWWLSGVDWPTEAAMNEFLDQMTGTVNAR
jgi:hypothetical protein